MGTRELRNDIRCEIDGFVEACSGTPLMKVALWGTMWLPGKEGMVFNAFVASAGSAVHASGHCSK